MIIDKILMYLLSDKMQNSDASFDSIINHFDSMFTKKEFYYYRNKLIKLYEKDMQGKDYDFQSSIDNTFYDKSEKYITNEMIYELRESNRRLEQDNIRLRNKKITSYIFEKALGFIANKRK